MIVELFFNFKFFSLNFCILFRKFKFETDGIGAGYSLSSGHLPDKKGGNIGNNKFIRISCW